MKKLLTLFLLFISSQSLLAQLIKPFPQNEYLYQTKPADNNIKKYFSTHFDKQLFDAKRLQIPELKNIGRITNSNALIELPLANGNCVRFYIAQSEVLSKETALLYPDIHNYDLQSVDRTIIGRITYSSFGFNAMLLTPDGRQYIVPFSQQDMANYAVYNKKDYQLPNGMNITCGVKDEEIQTIINDHDDGNPQSKTTLVLGDCQLRTYKFAVAATGEFTTLLGSQAAAMTSITTSVANISLIYERDLAIHFTLVTNNSVIYTDANTDPYATVPFPTGATLDANTTALNAGIGAANYDLGFVFNNGWNGGLAYTPGVCNNAVKGGAAAGINGAPYGSVMENTVAHEAGHLFSAKHTMSTGTNAGPCTDNLNLPTAYEIGGGSTIMAYAGSVCAGLAYQNNSDDYFHYNSLSTIMAYAISQAGCGSTSLLANAAPSLTVPSTNYTIPKSTPFALTANGTDLNAANILKYTFDEYDLAAAAMTAPPPTTATSGPMFRSYPPSTSNTRNFPPIANIIANTANTWEVLPSVARTLNFKVLVRDNAGGGSCVAQENIAVTVNSGSGPFAISSQNTASNFVANGVNTIPLTWNVTNTTAAPISSANVDILFSTDDGATFPYTLATATANDGTENIIVPNLNTTNGRIKVKSSNNIFFDINDAKITITSSCGANGATFTPSNNVNAVAGNAALNLGLSSNYGTSYSNFTGSITAGDPATGLSILNSGSCAYYGGNEFRYDLFTFQVNVSGTYTFTKTAGTPFLTVFNIYDGSFNSANPCSTFITSNVDGGTYNNSCSASLSSGITYVMAVGTFDNGSPALPVNYTINFATPGGGGVYTNTPSPGAGFTYNFVIVNTTLNTVKAFSSNGDMSNAVNFPAGTYRVYGLSRNNSVTQATLNTYLNGSFDAFQTALLNNTICGNLSTNSILVTVSTPLANNGIKLNASQVNNKVSLDWSAVSEKDLQTYLVEKSATGKDFEPIGNIMTTGKASYSFYDEEPFDGMNYYRINGKGATGNIYYSNVASINTAKRVFGEAVIFPNPTSGIANVILPSAGTYQCELTDISGKVLRSFNAAQSQFVIDMNSFSAGVYLLRCSNQTERIVTRIVRE